MTETSSLTETSTSTDSGSTDTSNSSSSLISEPSESSVSEVSSDSDTSVLESSDTSTYSGSGIAGSSSHSSSASSSNAASSATSSSTTAATPTTKPTATPTVNPTTSPTPVPGISDTVFAQRLASEQLKLDRIAVSQAAFEVDDSLDGAGDNTRIANVMRKAKRGEKVTIGILGDSIGYGAGASPLSNSFASMVNNWWTSIFGNENVEFVNASIGSNTLTNIVHRMDDDLLSHDPDLVVFCPHTFHDLTNDKIACESIIKRMLDRNIAVIVLILTTTNGVSKHDLISPIAQHYNVPVVSFAKAYVDSDMPWSTIGADTIHPNNTGHSLISLCVNSLFVNIGVNLKTLGTSPAALPSSAYQTNGLRYVDATLWDRNDSDKFTVTERGSFVNYDKTMVPFRTYNGWKSTEPNTTFVCDLPKIDSLHVMFSYFSGGGTAYITVTTQSGVELCKDIAVNTNASSLSGYSWNSELLVTNIGEPITVSIRSNYEVRILGFMVS